MSIEKRPGAFGEIRQFCRWCEDEYGHEFNPHGPWLPPTPENYEAIQKAEREHDLTHHTAAVLTTGEATP